MTQAQDELAISDGGDKIAEPRLDARVVDGNSITPPFSRRDETIGLLIVTGFVCFIANIAVRQVVRSGAGYSGAAFSVAVIGSQWILLAIWVGLGNWPLPFRLLSVMVAVAAELLLTIDGDGPPEYWDAVWGGSLLVIATSLPFGLLKLIGLRLVHQDSVVDQQRRPPSIQFSVRNLLSWTASAGIVAALVRGLPGFDWRIIEPVLIFAAATAALGGTAIWATLSRQGVWPRVLAPFAVAVLIGLLFAVSDAPASAIAAFFSATVLGTVAIMVVLLLFRRLGWRIAFRPAVVKM